MKKQYQCISTEQADRLKVLGIKQESIFYHTHSDWGIMPVESIDFTGNPASAFTVAELGIMLPERFYTIKSIDQYDKHRGDWICISQMIGESRIYGPTEAIARCAMLIHLLESKLITAEEVNSRI